MKSKRILLVVPSHDGEVCDQVTPDFFKNPVIKYMPLGVLSLAAYLKRHEVSVLDASSKGLSVDEVIYEIEAMKPEILGISAVTYRAWAMTEILKRSNVPIKVVGGPHTTNNHEIILRQGAKAVFIGDAELALPQWIDDGCPDGVFMGQPVDLNKGPLPNRSLLDLDDYRIEPNDKLLFNVGPLRIPMYSSKGCPYKCIYCDVQQKTFNWKSPEKVVEEFHSIIELGASSVHILDDVFNINKERVKKICSLMSEDGVNSDWSVRGGVEINEDVIRSLSLAGCKRYHVGIEHLDDNILRYFRKAHRYKNIEKFCKLCDKYGILILAYFIIGVPGETAHYRKMLPGMIKKLNIKIPYFNILSPLNGTPYYTQLIESGKIEKDYWAEFISNPVRDFVMPSGRSKSEEDELGKTLNWYMEIFHESPS